MPSTWTRWPLSPCSCLILVYSFIRSLQINLCCSSWALLMNNSRLLAGNSSTILQPCHQLLAFIHHLDLILSTAASLSQKMCSEAVMTIWAQHGTLWWKKENRSLHQNSVFCSQLIWLVVKIAPFLQSAVNVHCGNNTTPQPSLSVYIHVHKCCFCHEFHDLTQSFTHQGPDVCIYIYIYTQSRLVDHYSQ